MGKNVNDLLIIGSGPAGLTAAIYAARANLNPLVLAGITPLGQLMGTTEVENFPGFPEGIMGPQLMTNMQKQAEKFGAKIEMALAKSVDFKGKIKTVTDSNGNTHKAKSIIIAVGSAPRTLGLKGEQVYWGKGVSTCATCDGAFFKEKQVAVVGGGDSAAEESTFLTRFASKVYLIVRRDKLRASKIMQKRVFDNKKIEILWNTEVKEILGDSTKVSGLKVVNNKTNKESTLNVSAMFLAIGHIPNTTFLGNNLKLDEKGYILVKKDTHTSVDGVFVAGDVHDYRYQQAITAAGMGCMAALDAQHYLEENKF